MRRTAALLIFAALRAAPAQNARIDSLFAPPVRAELNAVLAGAAADRLPSEPLVQRALEGARRGVEPARVVSAVRAFADRLRIARSALGPASTDAELVAGAGVLYAGADRTTLERLRRVEPRRDLALPLIVMADIIERGVPRDTATSVIIALGEAHVRDVDYQLLRQSIVLDIGSGATPAAAAAARARGILLNPPGPRPPR